MSINNEKSTDISQQNSLSADEAFIQSLYDEIERDIENSVDYKHPQDKANDFIAEQPSKGNDNSILAAAHRAVSSKPKVVNNKRGWAIPVASAASLALVFSLFINQLTDPLIQQEITIQQDISMAVEASKAQPLKRRQRQPSEKISLELATTIVQSSSTISSEETFDTSRRTPISPLDTLQALKQNQVESATVNKNVFGDEVALVVAQTQKEYKLTVDKKSNEAESDVKEKSSMASHFTAAPKSKVLEKMAYEQLVNDNAQWLLLQENEKFYLIQVFTINKSEDLYQLAKKTYYIAPFSSDKLEKKSFKQIVLLDDG